MLAAAIFAGALLQPADSPRYREVLENGVRISVERMGSPSQATMVLAASLAAAPQNPDTHGLPHLIEHLAARGSKGDVDRRLEKQGMSLSASTTRDAILIEVTGTPEQMPFAALILGEIARSLTVTPEQIAKEIQIIGEEMALTEGKGRLASSAWMSVFGNEGLDALGSRSAMEKATPESVSALHAKLFAGRNLSVSLVGGIDPVVGAGRLKEVFGILPAGAEFQAPLRSALFKPGVIKGEGKGEVRAVLTEGLDSTAGMALVAASLAAANQFSGVGVTYNPSLWRSLVLLSAADPQSFRQLDALSAAEKQSLHGLGMLLLKAYLQTFRSTTTSLARFQAQMSLQNPTLTLDRLQTLAGAVTPQQFAESLDAFTSEKALVVQP